MPKAKARRTPKLAAKRERAEAAIGESKTQSDKQIAEREFFEEAYFEWLRARAANHDPDRPTDEETRNGLADEEKEAQRALMLTPAPWIVWQKLEVFESELSEDMRNGPRSDCFLMLALGAIKTDLVRLGIGDEGAAQ